MKNLAACLRAWREVDGIGIREAAQRLGLNKSTLSRLENEFPCDGATLAIVLKWILKP